MLAAAQIFDPKPLADLRSLDPESTARLINKLIDIFTAAAEPNVLKLEIAVSLNNADEVFNIAHSMKSSSGTLGALEFSRVCGELESLGVGKDPSLKHRGSQLCTHLLNILPATLAALREQKS